MLKYTAIKIYGIKPCLFPEKRRAPLYEKYIIKEICDERPTGQ
jgi:hypothetical protein